MHPEIIFAIDTAFAKLEREKITPWAFLTTNEMPPIEDYHGRVIQYRGVKFEGSPELVFWRGFVDPFLEALIGWGFKLALDHARERGLDPQPCIDVAQQALENGVSRILNRMKDIDRRLRGNGSPEKVHPRDVTAAKGTFFGKIKEYKASAIQASVKQPNVPENKEHTMVSTESKAAPGWKEIEAEYHISKRTFGKKINFVKDEFRRKIIFRDIEQAYFLASNGFYKPAVILAGGVIEELLRLYLVSKSIKLSDNTLNSYIQICIDKGILKTAVYKLADTFREFRNLVHLAREESPRHTISRPTAKSAVASIFTIANDFNSDT